MFAQHRLADYWFSRYTLCMNHFQISVFLAAVLAVSIGGCSKRTAVSVPVQQAESSHQRMVNLLDQVAEQAFRENEYFNSITLLPEEKAKLQKAIDEKDLVQQLELHAAVGRLEMNHGNSESAAAHFKAACDLAPTIIENKIATITPASQVDLYLKCGVANLRMAEDQNCVHCTNGQSCILPISPEGVHQQREGALAASEYFRRVLEIQPKNVIATWLLNIAAMTLGEYPDGVPEEYRIAPERFESSTDFPRFRNISFDLGLDTLSHSGGAIAEDFDGDGLLDVMVSSWHPKGQLRHFENQGDGSFKDVTERSNLLGITGGLNIVHADYDNDGDIDLLVLRGAWLRGEVGKQPNSLLQNDGTGRFYDVTFSVGLADVRAPTQTAAWADFDLDGDLDLFVGNELVDSQLFRNDGAKFVDIAAEAGATNEAGYAKAVAWGDYDNDRYPDLYISNLGQPNRLLHNNRDGTFTDVARKHNVTGPADGFACWFFDHNNDGYLDLYVGSYTVGVKYVGYQFMGVGSVTESDKLYEFDGSTFKDVSQAKGLTNVTQPMGCNFGDLDNDGFLDFYLGTGYPGYDGLMPNVMYHNQAGDGFVDVTFSSGFGHLQKGHGVAFADFDHDGDQDVFIELGGAFEGDAFHDALFENPGFGNNWIKIQCVGVKSNAAAIGAKIKLIITDDGKKREIHRQVSSGSSFGGNPLRQEIGVGAAQTIDRIEIYWPKSNETDVIDDGMVNQMIRVVEGSGSFEQVSIRAMEFKKDAD